MHGAKGRLAGCRRSAAAEPGRAACGKKSTDRGGVVRVSVAMWNTLVECVSYFVILPIRPKYILLGKKLKILRISVKDFGK